MCILCDLKTVPESEKGSVFQKRAEGLARLTAEIVALFTSRQGVNVLDSLIAMRMVRNFAVQNLGVSKEEADMVERRVDEGIAMMVAAGQELPFDGPGFPRKAGEKVEGPGFSMTVTPPDPKWKH